MEWPFNDPDFGNELDNVLRYDARESKVRLRHCGNTEVVPWSLETDKSWTEWLSGDMFLLRQQTRPGLGVILASRADEDEHNSSILEYLPFSRDVFGQIAKALPLHGDTARILNRCDQAMFESIDLRHTEWNAIFYCCRTTSKYAGDVAVSSVFYPSSGFTAAVFFGCDNTLANDITGRMKSAENTTSHPLLVIGFLAETERERHLGQIDGQVSQLLTRVNELSRPEKISMTSTMNGGRDSVELYIKISELRSELETWKDQLFRMIEHIEQLEQDVFTDQPRTRIDSHRSASSGTVVEIQTGDQQPGEEKLASLRKSASDEANWRQHGWHTGRRIKTRLHEIINDYNQSIRRCTIFMDGLILANQMSWNQIGYQDTQTNLRIASDTKQDSSQMKSIATLTMIFLPATFVSSVFSMSFFNWHPDAGEKVVSPYMWIYPVIVLGITMAVIGVWNSHIRRSMSRPGKVDKV